MSKSRPKTRSQLESKLKSLDKKVGTLNHQIKKIISDGQFILQTCRERLINICDLHGEIAANIYAISRQHATTLEEEFDLLSEAKSHCEKAIEDLQYIRLSPSRDLIALSNEIKQALATLPVTVAEVVYEEMEVDVSSESEEKADAMELDPTVSAAAPPKFYHSSSSSPLFTAFIASQIPSQDRIPEADSYDIRSNRYK